MSSVTVVPLPTAIYREDQHFAWWVYALMATMVGLACLFLLHRPAAIAGGDELRSSMGITVGFALPTVFVLGFLRMTTIVSATCIEIWFGFVPTYRRRVAIDTVTSVEVVTYRPVADCGGWGIRSTRDGERVLNARGNRGVRVRLSGGGSLLIGSQDPEALAAAIEVGTRPVV